MISSFVCIMYHIRVMTGNLAPSQLLTHGLHQIITTVTSRRLTCYDIAIRPLE